MHNTTAAILSALEKAVTAANAAATSSTSEHGAQSEIAIRADARATALYSAYAIAGIAAKG